MRKKNSKTCKPCLVAFFVVMLYAGAFFLGATTAAWAYYYSGIKWSGTSVTYYINNGFTTAARTSIRASDATWDGAGSRFRFNYSSTTTRNPNGFSSTYSTDGKNDVGYYNNGRTGIQAVARTTYSTATLLISEVDTTFNTYYSFSTSGAAGYYDVQDTMTHEFGHWLYLGDAYSIMYGCGTATTLGVSTEVTMCGYGATGNIWRRSLASDDISGIKAAYGI